MGRNVVVPIFLERFLLPILTAIMTGIILLNPFKFDMQQRFALGFCVVGLAYFVAHTQPFSSEAVAFFPDKG
jgi:hypothetical protein